MCWRGWVPSADGALSVLVSERASALSGTLTASSADLCSEARDCETQRERERERERESERESERELSSQPNTIYKYRMKI